MYPRLGCLAEAGEQEAITRPAAWPLDLALADAHLILENQALKPEFGLGMTPVDEGVPSRNSERGTGVSFGAGERVQPCQDGRPCFRFSLSRRPSALSMQPSLVSDRNAASV